MKKKPKKKQRIKRDGPFTSELKKLDVYALSHGEVPTSLPTREEPSNLAFCPLLVKYAGKGMCGHVNCRTCELPALEYEHVDYLWLCTRCADGVRVLPYWGDGRCECCGKESFVLMMCRILD